MYYDCEVCSKARSLGNARKRMEKSPPRYHGRDIFVSCAAAGNYPTGNNGNGDLDGGINYSIGLNERLLSPFSDREGFGVVSRHYGFLVAATRKELRTFAMLSS